MLAGKFYDNDPYQLAEFQAYKAEVLLRTGSPTETEAPARQAFEAYEKALGPESPKTARSRARLGTCARCSRKTDEAEGLIAGKSCPEQALPVGSPRNSRNFTSGSRTGNCPRQGCRSRQAVLAGTENPRREV